MKKNLFLALTAILLFQFFGNKALAQYAISTSGSNTLISCDSVQQSLSISKSSAFQASDLFVVKLDLNDSIELILPVLENDGTISVSNDTLFISGVDSVSQFTITYYVQANCNFIIQQSGILTYNQNISANINGNLLTTNKTFTITPAILVYRGGLNLNVTNARIGQTIERTYIYKNTSSQAPFTGTFRFSDSLYANSFDAGLRFDTVYVSSSNGTELSHLITDTSASLTIHVNSLVQTGDSLVIKERITMIDCANNNFDNSQTLVTAYYGCNESELCKKAAVPNELGNIIFAKIDPNMIPRLKVFNSYEIGDCYFDELDKRFTFKNIGPDTARNTTLYVYQPKYPRTFELTTIDTADFEVSYFNGNSYENLPFTITRDLTNYLSRVWMLNLNRKLAPQDSVFLSFKMKQTCISSDMYDSIGRNYDQIALYSVYVGGKLDHPCKTDSMTTSEYSHYRTKH